MTSYYIAKIMQLKEIFEILFKVFVFIFETRDYLKYLYMYVYMVLVINILYVHVYM